MSDEQILKENESKRQECEVYTRCMGYFRPVSQFNKGKQSEYKDRVWFTEEAACRCQRDEDAA